MSELISEPALAETVDPEISSVTDTVRFSAIPTKRFVACGVCNQACLGEGENFAFQVTLPPSGPESPLTAHGRFIATLTQRGLIGATICIHTNEMKVMDDPTTLSLLITLINDRDRKSLSWARQIFDQATMAIKRLQASGQ